MSLQHIRIVTKGSSVRQLLTFSSLATIKNATDPILKDVTQTRVPIGPAYVLLKELLFICSETCYNGTFILRRWHPFSDTGLCVSLLLHWPSMSYVTSLVAEDRCAL